VRGVSSRRHSAGCNGPTVLTVLDGLRWSHHEGSRGGWRDVCTLCAVGGLRSINLESPRYPSQGIPVRAHGPHPTWSGRAIHRGLKASTLAGPFPTVDSSEYVFAMDMLATLIGEGS